MQGHTHPLCETRRRSERHDGRVLSRPNTNRSFSATRRDERSTAYIHVGRAARREQREVLPPLRKEEEERARRPRQQRSTQQPRDRATARDSRARRAAPRMPSSSGLCACLCCASGGVEMVSLARDGRKAPRARRAPLGDRPTRRAGGGISFFERWHTAPRGARRHHITSHYITLHYNTLQ